MALTCVTQPAAEPVTVAQLAFELRLDIPTDPTTAAGFTDQLTRSIVAARQDCENYCRRVFLTQTWLWQLDGFREFRELLLPNPSLIAIEFFRYIDFGGISQALPVDTSYGQAANLPTYGYQLSLGGDSQPARLLPRVHSIWPVAIFAENAVQIQYKAGYGGPVTAGMLQGSALLSGATFLPGEVGRSVSVPGAGAAGAMLQTSIASIDSGGIATLAASAATAVTGATAWVGNPLPMPIYQAIIVLAKAYFNEDYEPGPDQPLPQFVADRLGPYRNLVS